MHNDKKYQMMRTTAGNKLVLIVESDDFHVWIRKWRAVSRQWTQIQKLRHSEAGLFKPTTDEQWKWFIKTKRAARLAGEVE